MLNSLCRQIYCQRPHSRLHKQLSVAGILPTGAESRHRPPAQLSQAAQGRPRHKQGARVKDLTVMHVVKQATKPMTMVLNKMISVRGLT